MAKILVGCPIADHYEYCAKEYINAIKSLTYKKFDILLIDNSKDNLFYEKYRKEVPMIKTQRIDNLKEMVARDRDLLRQKAIEGNYDYFFSLEADVIPPIDVIERLLAHEKDIVSGVYYKEYDADIKKEGKIIDNKKLILPLVWVYVNEEDVRQLFPEEVEESRIIEAAISGMGCLFISRKVFENVKFRVELPSPACDDVWFGHDTKKAGYSIFVDTSIKCKHILKGKKIKF